MTYLFAHHSGIETFSFHIPFTASFVGASIVIGFNYMMWKYYTGRDK